MDLPVTYRPAREEEFPAIRQLIQKVNINPLGLDWRRFIVAVDEAGRVLACGQIKPHRDGSLELASIAVEPEYQGRGLGSRMVDHLVTQHRISQTANPAPLYLTCRSSLRTFYARFGFQEAGVELPPYFRRIQRFANIFFKASGSDRRILVMVLAN